MHGDLSREPAEGACSMSVPDMLPRKRSTQLSLNGPFIFEG